MQMPDIHFIFRTHPVLPYTMLSEKYTDLDMFPQNCSVSVSSDINTDFDRCSFLLYRGSSVALYAVLNGLRPIYYGIPGEMSIDPLYLLGNWHITVQDTQDFETSIRSAMSMTDDEKQKQYSAALTFCKEYAAPPDASVVYNLVASKNQFNS